VDIAQAVTSTVWDFAFAEHVGVYASADVATLLAMPPYDSRSTMINGKQNTRNSQEILRFECQLISVSLRPVHLCCGKTYLERTFAPHTAVELFHHHGTQMLADLLRLCESGVVMR
jgi:hypothetical protein